MPPKTPKGKRATAASGDVQSRSADEQAASMAKALETQQLWETVAKAFQQVHLSAANVQRCKKTLLGLLDGTPGEGSSGQQQQQKRFIEAVCGVVLLILKQVTRVPADQLKRHYTFLTELSKAFREKCSSDDLAIAVLQTVESYANANDKSVRLAVISTFETLLRTVDQTVATEERQDFYQSSAEMLKHRVHDRCPHVREKAVAAVACFQTGKKNCDVTQQLLVLLCTDSAADVRRQILRSIVSRKEFLEGYFHGMVRSTRDVVARVRAEAWDALSRFPWKYIAAYANAKHIKLYDMIVKGLTDSNSTVQTACRAALCNSWLQRDAKGDPLTLLELITTNCTIRDGAPYDMISNELLLHFKKHARRMGTASKGEDTPAADSHGTTHQNADAGEQRRESGQRDSNNSLTSASNSYSAAAGSLEAQPPAFALNLKSLTVPGVLMWKAHVKLSSETEGEDETELLPPLDKFGAILQDLIYAYARPDAERSVVALKNEDDADNLLRLFLSAFDIYDESGYLVHTDNNTRRHLVRVLGFLLKVVPDDEPDLFVNVAIRALKSLTARTPEESSAVIVSSLDALFRSLQLLKADRAGHAIIGYNDVEAFRRLSMQRADRVRELKRKSEHLRRTGDTEAFDECVAEYEAVKLDTLRDEKFLLRMQYVVLAFLSSSERNDEVPTFCSHVIQLGQQQMDEAVRAAAIKSLGLQCLINPQTVHTFTPLIMADAIASTEESEGSRVDASSNNSSDDAGSLVSVTALGVLFDLVMEYGLKFFSSPSSAASPSLGEQQSKLRSGGDDDDGEDDGAEEEEESDEASRAGVSRHGKQVQKRHQRKQEEQRVAEEDTHKAGAANILQTVLRFLSPVQEGSSAAKRPLAIIGFCKLLSANRVQNEVGEQVLSELLLHYSCATWQKKNSALDAYLSDFLDRFFRSFSASHPKRQAAFAVAGVAAFRVLLQWNVTAAIRLIEFVLRNADACALAHIRDIDPDTVRKVVKREPEQNGGASDDDGVEADLRNRSARAVLGARGSTQAGRLMRELSKYSLHEYIARELIVEMDQNAASVVACLDILQRKLYFYGKAHDVITALRTDGEEVASRLSDVTLAERLRAWLESAVGHVDLVATAASGSTLVGAELPEPHSRLLTRPFSDRIASRDTTLELLFERGYSELDGMPPQAPPSSLPPAPPNRTVSAPVSNTTEVSERQAPAKRKTIGISESDVFGVEAIVAESFNERAQQASSSRKRVKTER